MDRLFEPSHYYVEGENLAQCPEYEDGKRLYRTFAECAGHERISHGTEDWKELLSYKVTKKYLFDADRNRQCEDIAVIFGRDMVAKEILVGPELLTDDEDDLWNAFDGMWIDVPTPFKEGDIVFTNGRCSGRIPRPFVLTSIASDKKTERDRKYVERRLAHGDSMDMVAYGYRINKDNGEVYLECDHDYLSVEYYEEELQGYERTLYAVSAWMSRKDVGLQSLMNSYLHVLTDEEWKRQKRNWRWDLEHVGIVRHNK